MKRITRLINAGPDEGERVWLDQFGHWTRDSALAFAFEDDEASRRIKRLMHATTEDVEETQP
jgi:hypothetical protein